MTAADSYTRFIHVLLIQGIEFGWTDAKDLPVIASEITGLSVTLKPGLKVPDLTTAIDITDGTWRTGTTSFKIVDHDGTLDTLFGLEPDPADTDYLGETLEPAAAGTALGATIQILANGANETVDPAGKHIGIEAISDARVRNSFYPLNFATGASASWVAPYQPASYHLPPIPVTDVPTVFEGRIVTLYRFYRNEENAVVYGNWSNAELAWWGVMRGKGSLSANRTWAISCYGQDGLPNRQLGQYTQTFKANGDWWAGKASLSLDTTPGQREDQFALALYNSRRGDPSQSDLFQSSLWDRTITATGSPQALADEINGFINDVVDGSDVTTIGRADFDDYTHAEAKGRQDLSMQLGSISINTLTWDSEDLDQARGAIAYLVLHEKVWKEQGFDPVAQSRTGPNMTFDRLETFDAVWGTNLFGGNITIPGPNYWILTIGTDALGRVDFGGNPRTLQAVGVATAAGTSLMKSSGGHAVKFHDAPFWESSPLQPFGDVQVDVGGTPTDVDSARYIAIRGLTSLPAQTEVSPVTGLVTVSKPAEVRVVTQVALCSWVDDGTGRLSLNNEGSAELFIEKFVDPRSFGINETPLADLGIAYWICASHEFAPLSTYAYAQSNVLEHRGAIMAIMMASTGTGSRAAGGTLTAGSNSISPTFFIANDFADASMGLAIPAEMIDASIYQAFEDLPGGRDGAFDRVRHAWYGAKNSQDVISSIVEPAGMAWSLHGNKYGLFDLFASVANEDADATITEADTLMSSLPSQSFGTGGQFHTVELGYRLDLDSDSVALKHSERARDFGARTRPGNLKRRVTDEGTIAIPWYGTALAARSVTGHEVEWRSDFEKRWQEAAEFFGARNFPIEGIHVSRPKGKDLRVGTVIDLTNPWPLNPLTGTRGVTNATARVFKTTHKPDGSCIISCLVYAESLRANGFPYYGPIARGKGYDSTGRVIYFYSDWRMSGDTTVNDVAGFEKPASAVGAGDARIRGFSWNGKAWDQGAVEGSISSVDTANLTITLTGAGLTGTYKRDRDYVWVMADYDDADQAAWVKNTFGLIVLAGGKGGTVPTDGKLWVKP